MLMFERRRGPTNRYRDAKHIDWHEKRQCQTRKRTIHVYRLLARKGCCRSSHRRYRVLAMVLFALSVPGLNGRIGRFAPRFVAIETLGPVPWTVPWDKSRWLLRRFSNSELHRGQGARCRNRRNGSNANLTRTIISPAPDGAKCRDGTAMRPTRRSEFQRSNVDEGE